MTKIELLIHELSKMPTMVIETAYLYASIYTKYGVDVTEKWLTAIQQTAALEKAYRKGYYEAMTMKRKLLSGGTEEDEGAIQSG